MVIYGGRGYLVQHGYISGTRRFIGLGIGKFGVNGCNLMLATVTGNMI